MVQNATGLTLDLLELVPSGYLLSLTPTAKTTTDPT